MPTSSPGDEIRELGLPGRAVSALTRAGITSVDQLAVLTRQDLAAVPGLGAGMVAAIRQVVPEPAAEDEAPPSPTVPSFDSLRAPQRRSALDALLPPAPAPAATATAPPTSARAAD